MTISRVIEENLHRVYISVYIYQTNFTDQNALETIKLDLMAMHNLESVTVFLLKRERL